MGNSSKKFSHTYVIRASGVSRYFEGDKFAFMEKQVDDCLRGMVEALSRKYKTLKINIEVLEGGEQK